MAINSRRGRINRRLEACTGPGGEGARELEEIYYKVPHTALSDVRCWADENGVEIWILYDRDIRDRNIRRKFEENVLRPVTERAEACDIPLDIRGRIDIGEIDGPAGTSSPAPSSLKHHMVFEIRAEWMAELSLGELVDRVTSSLTHRQ